MLGLEFVNSAQVIDILNGIRTPSRIHITLIDLNGSLGRIDGGIGLALEEPFVEIRAKECDGVVVHNRNRNDRFEFAAKRMREYYGKGIEVNVVSDFKPHVGLGSGTQISLAVGKAYAEIYDLDLSVRDIAKIMGRGGTSGIGVAVFEFGGFVLDGGHSRKEKRDFLPSSASKANPAPMLLRYDFPDWKIVLAIPDLTGFYGKGEINLFQKYCPIKLDEVRELCHLILMKLLPGIVESDLDDVGSAICRIQELGFKKIEIEQYGNLIKNCINLAEYAGMSSTGPTVYAFADTNAKAIAREFENYFKSKGIRCKTIITKPKNRGAEIV